MQIYLAEFPDGHIAEYSANMVAEAMYENVNEDGNEELLFEAIVDHCHDNNSIGDQELMIKNITISWKFCILWKDSSTTWHSLIDTKCSFPVQLAEYVIHNNLQNENAFKWWIKPTLKHREKFLKATKTRYAKRTH